MEKGYVFLKNESRNLFDRISDRIRSSETLRHNITVYYNGTNVSGDIKVVPLDSKYMWDTLKLLKEELGK